ncbi:MAG: phage tail tip lysozyme [Deltaproteobacteria bacterium]|nr:phage tail tip lysozyme [Deltaproteobacteria bacterium]
MTPLFRQKSPKIMADLMRDFPFTVEDAAAVVGNLGHESGGFASLQEIKPTVAGSKGGYGWAQWTGPRRRAFEAWCKAKGLKPSSDEANYGYLVVELRGDEKRAVNATRNAVGLEEKVKAFELAFERAGVKHYPSRIKYAKDALATYGRSVGVQPAPAPQPPSQPPVRPDAPKPAPVPERPAMPPAAGWVALVAAAIAAFVAWLGGWLPF